MSLAKKTTVNLKSKTFFLILLFSALFMAFYLMLFVPKLPNNIGKKVGDGPVACSASNLTGLIDLNDKLAYFDGEKVDVPNLAYLDERTKVLGVSDGDKWVEVDLSEQKLKAWEGDRVFLETLVSTGLPWTPTPTGEFRVWIKLRATKMEGGSGKYYYYLPNVPYVMFFENSDVPGWKGYGLHGTYWHNSFGTQRSHGCVNLPTEVAKQIYDWLGPTLPDGKSVVYASADNPGGRIVIHD